MDSGFLSTVSALAGAAIGGGLSLLGNFFGTTKQARAQWLAHDREHREELYKEFIEAAAKCYGDALVHDKPDLTSLVVLYAKMTRIRVLSSQPVIDAGTNLITTILETYSAPNRSVDELKHLDHASIDVLREFGQRCREEFDALRMRL